MAGTILSCKDGCAVTLCSSSSKFAVAAVAGSKVKHSKTKGYQPYFRGSLLQYYSDNKTHTCVKGKADRIPTAA